jgi:hypothetical protein
MTNSRSQSTSPRATPNRPSIRQSSRPKSTTPNTPKTSSRPRNQPPRTPPSAGQQHPPPPQFPTGDPQCGIRGRYKFCTDWEELTSQFLDELNQSLEEAVASGDIASQNECIALLKTYETSESHIKQDHNHELEYRKYRVYCFKHLGLIIPSLLEAPLQVSHLISYFQ